MIHGNGVILQNDDVFLENANDVYVNHGVFHDHCHHGFRLFLYDLNLINL